MSRYKFINGVINILIGLIIDAGLPSETLIILIQILSKLICNKVIKTIPPIIFPNNLNVKLINGDMLPAISIGFNNVNKYLIFWYANPMPIVVNHVAAVAANTTLKLLPIGAKPKSEIMCPKNKKQNKDIKYGFALSNL